MAAIKVGLDTLRALAFVLNEPKAIGFITRVGDSNIVLEFQGWVNLSTTDFGKARSIAISETKHALEHHGFSLPEPIYRLSFNSNIEQALTHLPIHKSQTDTDPTPPTTAQGSQTAAPLSTPHGQQADDVLDARADHKLMEKVDQEIAQNANETDLLSQHSARE